MITETLKISSFAPVSFFSTLVRVLRIRLSAMRIANELEACSDRQLLDIGINRGEIPGLARSAAEREFGL